MTPRCGQVIRAERHPEQVHRVSLRAQRLQARFERTQILWPYPAITEVDAHALLDGCLFDRPVDARGLQNIVVWIEDVAVGEPDARLVLKVSSVLRRARSPYGLHDVGRREVSEGLDRLPSHPEDARGLEDVEVDPFELVGSPPEEDVVQSDVRDPLPSSWRREKSVGEHLEFQGVQSVDGEIEQGSPALQLPHCNSNKADRRA